MSTYETVMTALFTWYIGIPVLLLVILALYVLVVRVIASTGSSIIRSGNARWERIEFDLGEDDVQDSSDQT